MLQATIASTGSYDTGSSLVDRVRDVLADRATTSDDEGAREESATSSASRMWARGAGLHVLLGMGGQEAFARLTPLGAGSYGLAFRAIEARPGDINSWEPLLLVDELSAVVEHALVAVDAVTIQ